MESSKMSWESITVNLLKAAIVISAMPRWIPALMLSEGLALPVRFEDAWVLMSAYMNGFMAIAEGLAISYVFSQLRDAEGKRARNLLILIGIMTLTFVMVLTPFVAASIREITVNEILDGSRLVENLPAILWGIAVSLTTMSTVGAVGYAQGIRKQDKKGLEVTEITPNTLGIEEMVEELKRFPTPVLAKGWLQNQGVFLDINSVESLRKAGTNNE